jgi:CO/xanthine dehydrogenase Mo-binding subunit
VITAVTGDTARTPGQGPTWGSQTIAAAGPTLRQVSADARYALLQRAAHLGMPQSALTVQDGVVRVKGNRERFRRVTMSIIAKPRQLPVSLTVYHTAPAGFTLALV